MNKFKVLSSSVDNGGVHINSGIPNKAAYNAIVSLNREKVEKFGIEPCQFILLEVVSSLIVEKHVKKLHRICLVQIAMSSKQLVKLLQMLE